MIKNSPTAGAFFGLFFFSKPHKIPFTVSRRLVFLVQFSEPTSFLWSELRNSPAFFFSKWRCRMADWQGGRGRLCGGDMPVDSLAVGGGRGMRRAGGQEGGKEGVLTREECSQYPALPYPSPCLTPSLHLAHHSPATADARLSVLSTALVSSRFTFTARLTEADLIS